MDKLDIIWQGMPSLLSGTLVTIILTFYFLALGVFLGIPLALGRVYGSRYLQALVIRPFERFFRAVPALVLLFLFYFGSSFFHIEISAFMAAVLALGLRSAAYQSEIFRGAIQSIGDGQMKAARSIGMNRIQSIRYIILPQALRLSIPPWANEYEVADASNTYWTGNQGVMVRENSELNIAIALTGGNTIGAQRGTTQADWLEENLVQADMDIKLELYETNDLGIMDLVNGRFDVFVADTPAAEAFVKTSPIKIIGTINTEEQKEIAYENKTLSS